MVMATSAAAVAGYDPRNVRCSAARVQPLRYVEFRGHVLVRSWARCQHCLRIYSGDVTVEFPHLFRILPGHGCAP